MSKVLVTGMGGELGTRVAQLLEEKSWATEIIGVDFVPPRRRLRRAEFRRIDPRDRDRLAAFVEERGVLRRHGARTHVEQISARLLRREPQLVRADFHQLPARAQARDPQVRNLPGPDHQLLARPESFYVQDVQGPLLDGEVQRAEVWGTQLAQSLVGELRDWG